MRILATSALLLLVAPQSSDELRRAIGDGPLVGDWIYDDIPAGFAQAAKTGKPLAVFLRCVP